MSFSFVLLISRMFYALFLLVYSPKSRKFASQFFIMSKRFFSYLLVWVFESVFFGLAVAQAQGVVVNGLVRDSLTGETLPYASVYFKGTVDGNVTDKNGKFSIHTPSQSRVVVVSMVGYKDKLVRLKEGRNQHTIKVRLAPVSMGLDEVVVKPKKEKYSKKNNPAVDFVTEMIGKRNLSDPKNHDYFSFEHYEKMSYAFDDFTKERNAPLENTKFAFLFDHVDTSSITGKPILVVSFKETLEDVYYRKDPEAEKRVVKAVRRDGIDELLPQESVQSILQEVFKEVNIFDDEVYLLSNRFVSPLSRRGPSYYKYYLLDTVDVDGKAYVNLGFVPFNSESFGFTGILSVSLDSSKFVRMAKLNVPKDINLNFVQGMSIEQTFERMDDGSRLRVMDDVAVEFNIAEQTQGVFARRVNVYRNHTVEKPDEAVFEQKANVVQLADAQTKTDEFWQANRLDELEGNEGNVKDLMSDLRHVPAYYYTEKLMRIVFSNYVQLEGDHSRFDFGPVNTVVSQNRLEGVRLRIGGMTTAYLNRHWFGRGYLAYGCDDETLKYQGQLEYSFTPKKEYPNEFPIHSVKATYEYDTDVLAQSAIPNRDNFFTFFKRTDDELITYRRQMQLDYKQEFHNNFSYDFIARHKREYSTWIVPFVVAGEDSELPIDDYAMSEFKLTLRYAPDEKFYQTRQNRHPINFDHPTYTVSHTFSKRGLLGSDYSSNITELTYQHRYWLSIFGYVDLLLKAAKQWNPVPFHLLLVPDVNMSYFLQSDAYSLMNTMEFINDQYASWDLTYSMNGFLLNRMPLIQRLKLREVFSFRGLYGSLTEQNDPLLNKEDGLFCFPEQTHRLGDKPYMELGVGVENIFKMLRVDYVWRLSYRGHPNIDHSGLRLKFHITF